MHMLGAAYWNPEEEMRESREVLLGQGISKKLSYPALVDAHNYVIKHSVNIVELLRSI